MSYFDFLPQLDRCCYCTRKLKVACILITFWSMFAAAHEIRVAFRPVCPVLYDSSEGPMSWPLLIFKWLLFVVNLSVVLSAFAFLVGIFLIIPLTADIFIMSGFAVVVVSFFYALFSFIQSFFASCPFNLNDVLVCVMYLACWVYFIIIVYSYQINMDEKE